MSPNFQETVNIIKYLMQLEFLWEIRVGVISELLWGL